MRRRFVVARLRPGQDDDLARALDDVPPGQVSEALRAALRAFLRRLPPRDPREEGQKGREGPYAGSR